MFFKLLTVLGIASAFVSTLILAHTIYLWIRRKRINKLTMLINTKNNLLQRINYRIEKNYQMLYSLKHGSCYRFEDLTWSATALYDELLNRINHMAFYSGLIFNANYEKLLEINKYLTDIEFNHLLNINYDDKYFRDMFVLKMPGLVSFLESINNDDNEVSGAARFKQQNNTHWNNN